MSTPAIPITTQQDTAPTTTDSSAPQGSGIRNFLSRLATAFQAISPSLSKVGNALVEAGGSDQQRQQLAADREFSLQQQNQGDRQALLRSQLASQDLERQRAQQEMSGYETPQQKSDRDYQQFLREQQYSRENPARQLITDASGKVFSINPNDPTDTRALLGPASTIPNPTMAPDSGMPAPVGGKYLIPPSPTVQARGQLTVAPKESGSDFERYYQDLVRNGTKDTPANRLAAFSDFQKNNPVFQASQTQRGIANQQHLDAETQQSYQFHAGRLEKQRDGISSQLDRISRLRDTLNQGSPQADALVAPELLTAMAGGQGSGLRMNEAEISRIVGGRTNWETLKAKLGAWQADPSKGFALTPAQRQQVGALLDSRSTRLAGEEKILDDAGSQLVTATSPQQHRAIYMKAQQALGAALGGNTASGTAADPLGIR